jgi:hypothetical protein
MSRPSTEPAIHRSAIAFARGAPTGVLMIPPGAAVGAAHGPVGPPARSRRPGASYLGVLAFGRR